MNISVHRHKVIICCVALAIGTAATIIYFGHKKEKTIESQIARPIVETPLQGETGQYDSSKDVKHVRATPEEPYPIGEMDLPLPDANIPPIDHLPSLRKWASLSYFSTEPNQINMSELAQKVKNIPIEIFTEDVTEEDVHSAQDLIQRFVLCYSGGSFSNWLELRGGPEAIATKDESDSSRKMYDWYLQKMPSHLKEPDTILELVGTIWDAGYSQKPYMNKVSFDLSFIGFHKQTQDEFDEQMWEPANMGTPNALQDEATKRGSISQGWLHRRFENKISPISVLRRDKSIKYLDILITTGYENEISFPVMVRYYYDPGTSKWLFGFAKPFYSSHRVTRGLFL